jgi:predicted Zn-dependent peptidase
VIKIDSHSHPWGEIGSGVKYRFTPAEYYLMNRYKKETLSNSLRLLTIPIEGVNSVTVSIFVGAGSRYEERRTIGLAHFCEHMFFKGTKKRPTAFAISSQIDGIGGEFNAGTGKDYTVFYIKADAKYLELALDVLSDMISNSLFDPQEIGREKGVIIEEINMHEDTPRERVDDILDDLLFGDHPLGWFTGGLKETVSTFKREDFLDYLNCLYSASNIVCTVAGKFEQKTIGKKVEEFLGSLPNFKSKKFIQAQGPKKERVKLIYKKTEQAHIALGVRAFSLSHPKKYALEVLNTILGRGMSSRLFINVRERLGLAYYIASSITPYQDTGSLAVLAGVDLSKIDKAIEVILSELRKLVKEKMPEKELAKAKDYISGRLILELEDSRGVAGFFGHQEVLLGKIETPSQIIEKIDKVEKEEVKRIAQELFPSNNLRLAVIGPFKEPERFEKILKM